MDILSELNREQLQAVMHNEGPMLVVAGAGTGKTQVITRRIARLIGEQKAAPGQILSLTFTEKAAREMEDRLYGLIGWQSYQVPVMTFNAFGSELLGRYGLHLGRSTRGGLITEVQKVLLLKQHFDRAHLEYYGDQANEYEFLERVVAYIGKLQNAGVTPEAYRAYVSEFEKDASAHPGDVLEQRDLASMYELYEVVKAESGTYDYHDQVALPVRILQERPNLAERLACEYRYVLVDEYQDTSPIQDALLRSFVPKNGNIFAVGDDDQAIYSFRGADIDNILTFTSHFAVEKPTTLVRNYRSGQNILDAAYRLIQFNNPDRLEERLAIDKRLQGLDQGGSAVFSSYASVPEEYMGIVVAIQDRLKNKQPASDIAVLSRSRAPLKALAKVLTQQGIDFSLAAEIDAFSEREVIHLWYLLQWVGGNGDRQSITHLLTGPFFGLDAHECRDIVARSKHDLTDMEEAIKVLADEGNAACGKVMRTLTTWRGWAAEMPVSQLSYRLVFDGGLAEALRAKGERESRILRVFEDLYRLLSHMQEYEEVSLDKSVTGYAASFPRTPKLQAPDMIGIEAGVQLLTIHGAKGLEFGTVFVMNATQRSWSEQSGSGWEPPDALVNKAGREPEHEQRRLLYVAATRAKRDLIVSAPATAGGGQSQPLSVLVRQLIPDAVHEKVIVEKMDKQEQLMQKLQRLYPLKNADPTGALPFETADGWLQLGVEALRQYNDCPYDFYLQYVLGIKEPFGTALSFGTVVHRTIHAYYDGLLRGEPETTDVLLARIDEQWRNDGYETREQAEADRERAKQTLVWFVERENNLPKEGDSARTLLGSEFTSNFELPEAKLRLRGRIDAYYQTPSGIEIRDFKTGRGQTDSDKLAEKAKASFQLRTYALAYEIMHGEVPSKVTLDYVVARSEGSAMLSPRILTNHREKLADMARRIRLRDFAPVPASEYHICAATKFYGEAYADSDEEAVVGETLL